MAITPYHNESRSRFYKAMRQRRYDDALQEVLPPDDFAEYWADKVDRELKRRVNTALTPPPAREPGPTTPVPEATKAAEPRESPQAALIRVLKSGQLGDARVILQRWQAVSRLSRPVHLVRDGLFSLEKVSQVRFDDQKIQALRDVFSCDQINDKSKVDWAILVCEADSSLPAADALDRLVNFISGLGLTCEGSLRSLHASISEKSK
jgi:hypothetical protein